MGIGALAAQMDFSDPVQEAFVEYVQRMADDYKRKLSPAVSGNKMSIKLDEEATIVPILIGMLLPAAQQTRAAARRSQSMNNSRQMVLAMHNYAAAHGKLPAQASYDKNGKPLLSWRVHMLPYMEQKALYDQFHLDEPWDSPHNKKLIDKMPMIYQSPSVAPMNGKTVYLGVAGEGRMFGPEPKGFGEITDGTSNTVLTVEVNPDHAVNWTQPEDWTPNERNPMEGLGGVNPGGFIVSFADGSVHFISNNVDPETWKALLTIGGGDVVNNF
jgi:type II secretory pathway pseudopilin PulG